MKKIVLALTVVALVGFNSVSLAAVSEKAQATSDQVTGSAESSVGELLGSDKMTSEGKTKKLKGDLRSAKEDVKDKVKAAIN